MRSGFVRRLQAGELEPFADPLGELLELERALEDDAGAAVGIPADLALGRAQALDHIALLDHIVRDLETTPTHTLEAERIIDELEHSFSGEGARRQFETAVDWGRYAELFTYDDSSGELTLDEEHRPGAARGAP